MCPYYVLSNISRLLGHPLLEKSTLIMQTIISDIAFSRSQIKIPQERGHNDSGSIPQCVPITVTENKFNSSRGSGKHKGLLHSPREELIGLYLL